MATNSVRPIPESYYYSGQGRLAIGDRDPQSGEYSNLLFVGNVTSLTVDIATTKFEHKESMSGQRAVDLTIIQEKNATFKFNAESLKLEILALGLFGTAASKQAGTSVGEIHKGVKQGSIVPLRNPNVSAVVIATTAGSPVSLVEGADQDYQVDEGFGTIYFSKTSAKLATAVDVSIGYTYGAFDQIDAFTQFTAPERYLRFEGLNTVDGSLRLIEIPRAAFDPLTGLEFINEELGAGEFNGNVLPDLTITAAGASQYFRERRVAAGGVAGLVPTINTATVANGAASTLALVSSQALTSSNPTGAGGFAIVITAGGGAAITVSAVAISGNNVALTLSRPVTAADVMTLSYTPPGSNPLANGAGPVAAFTGKAVTNNVA